MGLAQGKQLLQRSEAAASEQRRPPGGTKGEVRPPTLVLELECLPSPKRNLTTAILIICRCPACCSLCVAPKSVCVVCPRPFGDTRGMAENQSHLPGTFSAEAGQGDALPRFILQTSVLFSLLSATFLAFLCFLLGILKWAPSLGCGAVSCPKGHRVGGVLGGKPV